MKGPARGDLKLVLENIGGLAGRHEYTLKQGLNLISAPNAAGKTSIIRGLQALIMDSQELERRRYFLNAFERSARAELSWNSSRSVRRITGINGRVSVGGDPLHPEEKKCTLFAVASEDNELLSRLKSGKPLRNLLLEFSDYRYFELLENYLNRELERTKNELSEHHDTLARLKSLYGDLEEKGKLLALREEERGKLSEVSIETLEENKKLTMTLSSLDFELGELIPEIAHIHGEIQRLKNRISSNETQERRLRAEVSQFEKEHPDIERELEELDRELADLKRRQAETESRIAVVDDSLEKTNSGLEHYMEYGQDICPTCGQTITPNLLRDRQKMLEKEQREIRDLAAELKSVRERVERSYNSLSHYAIRVKSELRQKLLAATESLVADRKKIESLEKDLDTKVARRKKLIQQVQELETSVDKNLRNMLNRRRALDEEIARLDENLKTIKTEIENLGDVRSVIDYLVDEKTFLEEALAYVSRRAEEVKRVARERFNRQIAQVYSLMEFDEVFDRIYLDDNFDLRIVRRRKGTTTHDSVASLSRGEKETAGLVLMLAGKQEYLPDFPLFLADETSFYDATRFRRMVEFILTLVPYTVVTNLVPKEEQSGIKLSHTFS
ncbi:MAG: archaea-specific SMC-related protein [Fidelibacterota bacterium]